FFFFSSRRRHTRLQGDWSSDVCSSDLTTRTRTCRERSPSRQRPLSRRLARRKHLRPRTGRSPRQSLAIRRPPLAPATTAAMAGKIGRASCRERVEVWVGGGSGNEKRKT